MHNVNDSGWNANRHSFFEQSPATCESCHGLVLDGTILSRAAADSTLSREENGSVFVAKDTPITCTLCHENPLTGD
jgi:hypothetical protein